MKALLIFKVVIFGRFWAFFHFFNFLLFIYSTYLFYYLYDVPQNQQTVKPSLKVLLILTIICNS